MLLKTSRELQTVRALLERISYKPEWEFSAGEDEYNVYVRCTRPEPDAYDPSRKILACQHVSVSKPFVRDARKAEDILSNAIWRLVCDSEIHEAKEFFQIDGERPYDPHVSKIGKRAASDTYVAWRS